MVSGVRVCSPMFQAHMRHEAMVRTSDERLRIRATRDTLQKHGCCPGRRIVARLTLASDGDANWNRLRYVGVHKLQVLNSTSDGVLTSWNCVSCFVYVSSSCVGFHGEISFVFGGRRVLGLSQAHTCLPSWVWTF